MREKLVEAAHALAALGLVTAFGHVSARLGDRILITPAADLADVDEPSLVEMSHDATALPPRAPAEAWLHLSLYKNRPDIAAVARAQPPAAFATTEELRPVHGQASWLGRTVPVHDDARLLRHPDLAEAAAQSLPDGEALILRGNGAVTVGASPGDCGRPYVAAASELRTPTEQRAQGRGDRLLAGRPGRAAPPTLATPSPKGHP